MRIHHFFLGSFFALTLAGCSYAPPKDALPAIVRNSSYDAVIDVPQILETGSSEGITLHITKDGKPYDVEQDSRMIHLVFASADLMDIDHWVYPNSSEIGTYELFYPFTRPGTYRVWVEITDTTKPNHHGKDADLLVQKDLQITGKPLQPAEPASSTLTKTQDGYTLTLDTSNAIVGSGGTIVFSVRNAKGELVDFPPTDAAMFGMTNENFTYFMHGHGTSSPDGKSVIVSTNFTSPGTYAIAVQAVFSDADAWADIIGHFRFTVR